MNKRSFDDVKTGVEIGCLLEFEAGDIPKFGDISQLKTGSRIGNNSEVCEASYHGYDNLYLMDIAENIGSELMEFIGENLDEHGAPNGQD